MARLPDVEDMGARPVPESRRQIASVRNAGAVGEAASDFGAKAFNVVDRLEEIHDEDDVRRLDVEHAAAAREIRQRAREARGANAEGARQQAEQDLQRLSGQFLQRARSRRARGALEALVTRRTSLESDNIAEHTLRETTATMEAGMTARIESSVQQAEEHWQVPEAVEGGLATAEQEVRNRGQWRGASPDQIETEIAAVRSRIRSAVVEQMLVANDHDGAAAYLRDHGPEIDHEREVRYWSVINGEMELQQTEIDAAAAISGAAPAEAPEGGEAPPVTGAAAPYAQALQAQGLPPAVVAGFLGNMEVETGFRPRSGDYDGNSHGALQWRGERVENFRRIIGVHPNQATPEQTARFIKWEMDNPRAAGMTEAQRDAILGARTAPEAAELIDDHYERSDGSRRSVRASAAQRYAGGTGEGLPAADGRRVDLQAAYAWIEQQPWTERRKRLAREGARRYASENDLVRARVEEDANQAITQHLVQMNARGERLTNLNQIPADALANAPASTVLQLQAQIEANNRPEPVEANSPLMAELVVTAGTDPNRFLREVNPEMYRGQITDAEVEQLHRMRIDIANRTGPQPGQVLSVIRWVLPSSGIVPEVAPNLRGRRRREATQTREQTRRQAEGQLLSAVQARLARQFPQGTIVTQQDILNAVQSELTTVIVNGERRRVYEVGEDNVIVQAPRRLYPVLDDILRRSGLEVNDRNRARTYIRYRGQLDAAH